MQKKKMKSMNRILKQRWSTILLEVGKKNVH